ncbi:hypothetical protein O0L34_g16491 [Tuta absoluta]|nr:hypothetical protein O0L34_g16491 [Tuta absoluta]
MQWFRRIVVDQFFIKTKNTLQLTCKTTEPPRFSPSQTHQDKSLPPPPKSDAPYQQRSNSWRCCGEPLSSQPPKEEGLNTVQSPQPPEEPSITKSAAASWGLPPSCRPPPCPPPCCCGYSNNLPPSCRPPPCPPPCCSGCSNNPSTPPCRPPPCPPSCYWGSPPPSCSPPPCPPPPSGPPPCPPPLGWTRIDKMYPNPVKTPRAGIWPLLALLLGIASGLGLVAWLNRPKPKPPKRYYCYPPPPPVLEKDQPPNCCRPMTVRLYDDEYCKVEGEQYNGLPKGCIKIKILDPSTAECNDPCETYYCKPGDAEDYDEE